MLAEYFGGPEVLSLLSPDGVPAKSVLVFFLFSTFLQIMVWLYKKIKDYKNTSVQNYVETLRQSLGKVVKKNNFQFLFCKLKM